MLAKRNVDDNDKDAENEHANRGEHKNVFHRLLYCPEEDTQRRQESRGDQKQVDHLHDHEKAQQHLKLL